MSTPAAAEPQATATEAAPVDPMDKAEAAILARDEAPAGGAPAKSEKGQAKKPEGGEPKKARSPELATIAQREWKAQQAERAANEIKDRYEKRFGPLEQHLTKRDFVAFVNHCATEYGFTFADVVKAITEAPEEGKEKSPAEIAAETVRTELEKRDKDDSKARGEREQAEIAGRVAKQKEKMQALADAGTDGAPDRWDEASRNPVMRGADGKTLTTDDGKPVTAIDYAWLLVEQQYATDQTILALDQALDIVEGKLREQRNARRPKVDAGKPTAGGQAGNEAGATKSGGRVVKPSFSNRSLSGAAARAPVDDDGETPAVRSAGDEIARAARKAGISL